MIIVAVIAYIFWSIIGLILWLPLLFRVIASFCFSLSYNMMVNNSARIRQARKSVSLAVSFYVTGYRIINSALFEPVHPSDEKRESGFHVISFLGQLFWTILFWASIVFVVLPEKLTEIYNIRYSNEELMKKVEASLAVNDTSSAINYYTTAIKKNKFNAKLYSERGYLYYYSAHINEAIKDFSIAMKLDSNYNLADANFTYSIGLQLIDLEEYEEAIEYFNLALKYKPMFPNASLNRGFCYHKLDNIEMAMKDYDKTIESDSTVALAYNNKAIIMVHKGEQNKASILFDKARKFGYKEVAEVKINFIY